MILRNRHIVVIDDAESVRRFLRISLEAHGATVQVAATAAGGLALCEQTLPDLVVLDLGLPDNEGFNILPRLKRLARPRNLPVIILSVRKDQDSMEKASALGADAYLSKPCFIEDALETIRKLLGISQFSSPALVVPEGGKEKKNTMINEI